MKNIVVITSTPRKGGNSELLAEAFARGAADTGHAVETVYLRDLSINYCRGCEACYKLGRCVQKDDTAALLDKLMAADAIALASPVYFYNMSAQLKTLVDRLLPVYTKLRSDIYLLMTAADDGDISLAVETMRACTRDCLEDCEEKGVLAVGGMHGAGDIAGHPSLEAAYEMGKNA